MNFNKNETNVIEEHLALRLSQMKALFQGKIVV